MATMLRGGATWSGEPATAGIGMADRPGAEGAADHYWQGLIDTTAEAVALVDPTLRLLRTTPRFEGIVAASDGLAIVTVQTRPCLTATMAAEQVPLNAAIARAATRTAPVPAATRCTRGEGRAPLIVVAQPIPWAARLLRSDGGTAIVTLIDPGCRPAPLATLWREAFDLTRCETALAELLVAGHSVESAAAIRGSSVATLRVHLRRIFTKTGMSRQADLVALLMRIGHC